MPAALKFINPEILERRPCGRGDGFAISHKYEAWLLSVKVCACLCACVLAQIDKLAACVHQRVDVQRECAQAVQREYARAHNRRVCVGI
eukprot:772916-Pleurochrysis_carterae.AAC.1